MASTYGRMVSSSALTSHMPARKDRAGFNVLQTALTNAGCSIAFFLSSIMISGNKQRAFKIFYQALDIVKKNEKIDEDPLDVWKKMEII